MDQNKVSFDSVYSDGGALLLSNVEILVSDGDRVAIFGPNGSGKTSLLRTLAGLANANIKERPFIGRRLSFLPTRPLDLLLPWKTVSENCDVFRKLAKLPSESNRPTSLLTSLGFPFETHKYRKTYELSSGQQAMLALACCLTQGPEVLIADECLSTLSPSASALAINLIKESKATVIFSSHDTDLIRSLATKAYYVDGNKLVLHGS